jgi:hypothetical protein
MYHVVHTLWERVRVRGTRRRHMWTKYLLLVLGAFVLWGVCCDTGIIIEPPVNLVQGEVTDFVTGSPIDSAWINTDRSTLPLTHTDSQGRYKSPVGYSGKYLIRCGKEGYLTESVEITFVSCGVTAEINFQLSPLTE